MHARIAATCLLLAVSAVTAQQQPMQPMQPMPQQPMQPQQPQQGQPMAVFSGDGLTVAIMQIDMQTGGIAGVFVLNGQQFPFRGQINVSTDIEKINGTFMANGQQYPFSTVEVTGTEQVNLTTGNKTYRLMPVQPQQPAPQPQPQPNPNNPLDGGGPVPQPQPQPNPFDPAPQPQPPMPQPQQPVQPMPMPPAPQPQQAGRPETVKMTLHKFQDANMGMTSHMVLLPEGWQSKGMVQWANDFPERMFEITSPAGGRVRMIPSMIFSYTEAKPVQGMPQMPPQGIRPPANFPQWLVSFIQQNNQSVQNVALVSGERNAQSEQMQKAIAQQSGGNANGSELEAWIVTIEYDEAGVRRREQINTTFIKMPPMDNGNIFSQMWTLYTDAIVSAPVPQFDAMRPELMRVAGSIAQTPEWSIGKQKLIGELQTIRIEARGEAIKRRGEEIARMPVSPQQKESYYLSDKAQRDRVNTINETADYKDTDGTQVNLPMHYSHVWSDGKGNYVLSNNSQHKPGELWNELPNVK